MYRIRQQNGISPLTVLFTIAIVSIVVFLGFKLAPVYLEHFGVTSSLKSLEKDMGMRTKPKAELMRLLTRRLGINDVKRVSERISRLKSGHGRRPFGLPTKSRFP